MYLHKTTTKIKVKQSNVFKYKSRAKLMLAISCKMYNYIQPPVVAQQFQNAF